ncbi:MAG TPA: quaternary ammonium compound efflux SMR transporter SugE [Bacillota bacterium]|nr:quaternary ammonium compound efflux SMR transporter SugE [Bacillota bacterium]
MKWILLFIAGLCEIWWAIGLKYTHGFTKVVPSIITVIGMIASFYFLGLALKMLPLGTAYAIWTGIGTIGTVVLGVILFKEPVDPVRVICIGLILSGIIGLKLVSSH